MTRHRAPRVLIVGLTIGLVFGAVVALPAGAAPAQDAPTTTAPFDENGTEATIDRVRTSLVGVAAVTGALLVVYIWHTNPRRRLAVATRRREADELARLDALDDAFVLPGEIDDVAGAESDEGAGPGDAMVESDEDATVD